MAVIPVVGREVYRHGERPPKVAVGLEPFHRLELGDELVVDRHVLALEQQRPGEVSVLAGGVRLLPDRLAARDHGGHERLIGLVGAAPCR